MSLRSPLLKRKPIFQALRYRDRTLVSGDSFPR